MEYNWNDYFESPKEPAQPEQDIHPVEPPQAEAEQATPKVTPSPYADSPYVNLYDEVKAEAAPEKARRSAAQKKEKSGLSGWWVVTTILLVVISVAATSLITGIYWKNEMRVFGEVVDNKLSAMKQEMQEGGHTVYVPGGESAEGEAMTPGQVYAQNVQAVVAISGIVQQSNGFGYNEYESFGSGFIISEDGYVVSNYHVVEGAVRLSVIMHSGQEYEAKLVGHDDTNDISLLKIEAEGLPYVTIGSSDALVVGDRVAAIGNPLGELTATMTVGYVSAKDRVVTTDGTTINMLQTDAAINSGNSGGPLFNMQGEVIGITTAKYSGTSSSGATIEGIGFAIPIDDVIGMIEDLRDYGYVTGAYLGIMCRDLSADAVRDGLPAGVYIEEVTPGYAAEEAGLQRGDIIINLGGYEIKGMTDLTRILRKFDADQTTTITVYRSGREVNLTITLDEKPVEGVESVPEETYLMPGDAGFDEWYKDFIERHYGSD